jgi:hypothetical protein
MTLNILFSATSSFVFQNYLLKNSGKKEVLGVGPVQFPLVRHKSHIRFYGIRPDFPW